MKFVKFFSLEFTWLDALGWPCESHGCGSRSVVIGLRQEDLDKLVELLPNCMKDGELQKTTGVAACILGNGLGYFTCPRHEAGDGFPEVTRRKLPIKDHYPSHQEEIEGVILSLPPDCRTCAINVGPLATSSKNIGEYERDPVIVSPASINQVIVALELGLQLIDSRPLPNPLRDGLDYISYWEYFRPIGSMCNLHLCAWEWKSLVGEQSYCEISVLDESRQRWTRLDLVPKAVTSLLAALRRAKELMAKAPDWPHLPPVEFASFSEEMVPPGPKHFLTAGLVYTAKEALRQLTGWKDSLTEAEWTQADKAIKPLEEAGLAIGSPAWPRIGNGIANWSVAIEHKRPQEIACSLLLAVKRRDLNWLKLLSHALD